MEVYFDEKWKLSKKGSRREHSRREQQLHPNHHHHHQGLRRSSSMPESLKGVRTNLKRSQSSKSTSAPARSFSSRCANLVKEQRAKFYIMRRCVTMLICWRDYP